jgi:putative CocE/NonD family hydrolase
MKTEICILIPMRDGVKLAANLFIPDGELPLPGLMVRTPYGRSHTPNAEVEYGYCMISVDARGTGASEGIYDYYNMDSGKSDGYDLVEWLAAQDYCNGKVGVVGGSACGIYAICTAAERPPHLMAMCVDVAPCDFYEHQWYPGGVLRREARQGWCLGIGNRTAPGAVWDTDIPLADQENRIHKSRLLSERTQRFTGQPLEWSKPYFEQSEKNALWDHIDLSSRIDKVEVPTLFGAIMYDHFGKGSIYAHKRFKGQKRLTVVSGVVSRPSDAGGGGLAIEDIIAWFNHHMKGETAGCLDGEHWYITGAEERRYFQDSPKTSPQSFLLQGDGAWGKTPGNGEIKINHDPASPSLTALIEPDQDYRPFAEQEMVHCFDSAPCVKQYTVIGHPVISMKVRATHVDAQLVARICILQSDGETRMLNFGSQRLFLSEDRRQVLPYTKDWIQVDMEFWTVAHEFQPGDRLRVIIAGSESPFFDHPDHEFDVWLDVSETKLILPCLADDE